MSQNEAAVQWAAAQRGLGLNLNSGVPTIDELHSDFLAAVFFFFLVKNNKSVSVHKMTQ